MMGMRHMTMTMTMMAFWTMTTTMMTMMALMMMRTMTMTMMEFLMMKTMKTQIMMGMVYQIKHQRRLRTPSPCRHSKVAPAPLPSSHHGPPPLPLGDQLQLAALQVEVEVEDFISPVYKLCDAFCPHILPYFPITHAANVDFVTVRLYSFHHPVQYCLQVVFLHYLTK